MVPPCLHRLDDRAQAFADFSQRVFAVVVNAVGAWTEETLPAIPNTAKHLADVLAGTDVRTNKCPFLVNRTTKVWVLRSGCPISRIGQFMAMASGQRTRKTMMMIMAKPVRSAKVNVSPAHATAVMVAMTGSLVPSMVARTAPTRITPAM